jgi:CRP/FNR family cyclic AMP-dependent transcriptional regulator
MQCLSMPKKRARPFNTDTYLATAGPGRKLIHLKAKQIFSSQGGPADCLFYLRVGRAKLTILSKGGKEAAVTLATYAASRRCGMSAICSMPGGTGMGAANLFTAR